MKHVDSIASIISSLVNARKSKHLTQAELGQRLSLPQSYISRLEGCRIDSRVSTVLDIARFLGLEMVLVPVSMVPTVHSIIGSGTKIANKPLYTLDDIDDDGFEADGDED